MTVHATWNRRFPGLQILAFADRSYAVDFGSEHEPPLVTIGWYRWRPCSIDFPRRRTLEAPVTEGGRQRRGR